MFALATILVIALILGLVSALSISFDAKIVLASVALFVFAVFLWTAGHEPVGVLVSGLSAGTGLILFTNEKKIS